MWKNLRERMAKIGHDIYKLSTTLKKFLHPDVPGFRSFAYISNTFCHYCVKTGLKKQGALLSLFKSTFLHLYPMLSRLKKKWQVTTTQLWIIILVFGCTGTTAAYLTRFIVGWLNLENSWPGYSWLVRIGMLIFGYQVLLLFYGALFGQWKFFWEFEKKMLQRLGLMRRDKTVEANSSV